jgi:hypothetical protein
MSAQLQFHHPESGGTTCDLIGESISLGRDAENSVQVDHPSVSGWHAELICGESGVTIRDLQSTNGTWVNERKISCQALHDGDTIRFGDVCATYFALPDLQPEDSALTSDSGNFSSNGDSTGAATAPAVKTGRWTASRFHGIGAACFLLVLAVLITPLLRHRIDQSPETLLRDYLAAREWQDRLRFVRNPSSVEPLMREYYKGFKGPV